MLKMYKRHTQAGGAPEFWEENWSEQAYGEQLSFCDIDPLRPLFERYAPPGTTMLEGGCGMGQYVSYYTARGVRVVGLDFARETLSNIRKREPHLMLCAGDVAALPFRDESFDCYYSGGVVEHFEAGAEEALSEARRVLRPGGVLLISVPYLSPLRKLLLSNRDDWRAVSRPQVDKPDGDDSWQFFQYAYTRREFRKMLTAAGFEVISTQGYAIVWGLYELPLLDRASKGQQHKDSSVAPSVDANSSAATPSQSAGGSRARTLLKRLIVAEDASVPIAGLGVKVLRWASSNMMMYVCRRSHSSVD